MVKNREQEPIYGEHPGDGALRQLIEEHQREIVFGTTVLGLANFLVGYRLYQRRRSQGIELQPGIRGNLGGEVLERLTKWVFNPEYRGLHNWQKVNTERPLVLYFNHYSHADTVLAYGAIPRYFRPKVLIPMKRSYWGQPGLREVSRVLPTLLLDTEESKPSEWRKIIDWLSGGKIILVAPEGTRSRTGEMGAFRRGPAAMIHRTGAQAMPILIDGKIWHDFGPGTLIPKGRGPVRVSVGKPLTFEAQEGESNKAFGLRILEEMKVALEDLIE